MSRHKIFGGVQILHVLCFISICDPSADSTLYFHSVFQNGPYCKLILLLTKYFRLTNYIWMFCEGFYLHRLISTAFAEERSLTLFYVIGWGEYNSFIESDQLLWYGWQNTVYTEYKICLQLYQEVQKIVPVLKFLTYLSNVFICHFSYSDTVIFVQQVLMWELTFHQLLPVGYTDL